MLLLGVISSQKHLSGDQMYAGGIYTLTATGDIGLVYLILKYTTFKSNLSNHMQ